MRDRCHVTDGADLQSEIAKAADSGLTSLTRALDENVDLSQTVVQSLLRNELYTINVDVEIELPIFSDRREIEINTILNQWDKGVLTLRQTIEALAEYTSVIDLNSYDFTQNEDLWDYRQIQGYYELLNEVDLLKLDEVENQLDAIKPV